jgi:hypothetical protein
MLRGDQNLGSLNYACRGYGIVTADVVFEIEYILVVQFRDFPICGLQPKQPAGLFHHPLTARRSRPGGLTSENTGFGKRWVQTSGFNLGFELRVQTLGSANAGLKKRRVQTSARRRVQISGSRNVRFKKRWVPQQPVFPAAKKNPVPTKLTPVLAGVQSTILTPTTC